MKIEQKLELSLAYDDVLIRPGYSEVLPKEVQIASK